MADDKVILDESKYPSNSNKSKEKPEEHGELAPVVKGKVSKRRPSLLKKIGDAFISEDVQDVKGYLFYDILLPAIKDTLVDMGKSAIDMIFYGDAKSSSSNKKKKPYRVSYSSYYEDDDRKRHHERSGDRRKTSDFDDLEFDRRSDAEEVIDQLNELIMTYGYARVSDLYDFCDMPDNFTDNNYGWESLGNPAITRIRSDGEWKYIIDFPKPKLLD